jgi:hypothetical protein
MPKAKGVAARAVVTFENRGKLYIEVYEEPDFYNFYACTPVKPGGRKRKVPSHTWGMPQGKGRDLVEVVEKYVRSRDQCVPKVVKTSLRVYDQALYQKLLDTSPDQFGLTQIPPGPIPSYLPRSRGDIYLPPGEVWSTLQQRMDLIHPRKR